MVGYRDYFCGYRTIDQTQAKTHLLKIRFSSLSTRRSNLLLAIVFAKLVHYGFYVLEL